MEKGSAGVGRERNRVFFVHELGFLEYQKGGGGKNDNTSNSCNTIRPEHSLVTLRIAPVSLLQAGHPSQYPLPFP